MCYRGQDDGLFESAEDCSPLISSPEQMEASTRGLESRAGDTPSSLLKGNDPKSTCRREKASI